MTAQLATMRMVWPETPIGPSVKKGFVDHTAYDTTSILQFISKRWGMEQLRGVRPKMGDFSAALE